MLIPKELLVLIRRNSVPIFDVSWNLLADSKRVKWRIFGETCQIFLLN